MSYSFKKIEEKWQQRWEDEALGEVDIEKLRTDPNKFYILTMFPYPSGDRLHMGHWYQYGLMDSWSRFQRMTGKKVFQPMGFDAFGLPAENFAIKKGIHPDVSTSKNVAIMREQFKKMGVSFAWRQTVNTSKPEYYRWTQWLFLKFYEKGLAVRKLAPVNWCTNCQTVLANEQVVDGECERCGSNVIQKNLKQWFFRITEYAEKLLRGTNHLKWPSKTLAMQRNWIGKSTGTTIQFKVSPASESFEVFTTRPDTLFGVTYVVLAPEHPLVPKITSPERKKEIEEYQNLSSKMKEIDRLSTTKKKTGVPTGAHAINPANGEKVPIWIADYAIMSYGTGAVMAVPAHDERDYEFAKTFELPIKPVIAPREGSAPVGEAYVGTGELINSGKYNGEDHQKAKERITSDLEQEGLAKKTTNYRLRDWLISRQRYWGTPIPIVICPTCGDVPVPEADLPVELPDDVDFKPTGESPLARCESFVQTSCPKCSGPAEREVDTLDTFVCSSWYFLRFPNAQNNQVAFDQKLTNEILPVDKYVGGAEHACMHLLYARFFTMVLKDLGYLNFDEPFPNLTHQGFVLGRDGQKMSKSRGNSVSPDPYVDNHGSDILRLYLMFGFKYIEGGPWDDGGFKAVQRFMDRLMRLLDEKIDSLKNPAKGEVSLTGPNKKLLNVLHHSIKMITTDTNRFQFNTSIARLMELLNAIGEYLRLPEKDQNTALVHEVLTKTIVLLAPFAPHFAEEYWERTGHTRSIFFESWPRVEEKYLELDEIKMAVMINGKFRDEILVPAAADKDVIRETALASNKVSRQISGKEIRKEIIVPKKLINFIVG